MDSIKFRRCSSLKNCTQVHDFVIPGHLYVRLYRSVSGIYYVVCYQYITSHIFGFCACGSRGVSIRSIVRSFSRFQSCHVL